MKAKKLKELVNKLNDDDEVGIDMEEYVAYSFWILDGCDGENDDPVKVISIVD